MTAIVNGGDDRSGVRIVATDAMMTASSASIDPTGRNVRTVQIVPTVPTVQIVPTVRTGRSDLGSIDRSDPTDRLVPKDPSVLPGRNVQSDRRIRRAVENDADMRKPHALLWVTLLLFPLDAFAQGEQWQVGMAPSFSSGRYGTETRTEVFYTPFTARRLFDNADVTFVIPLTCIRGNGSVTLVNGMPVRQERLDAAATTGTTSPTRTGSTDTTTRTGTTSTTSDTRFEPVATSVQPSTNCGLGDVVVRGRYYALDERGWMPTIAVRAHVKIPTASDERRLGTGRPDEGVGVEITRTIGGGLLAMLDAGYTVIGDAPDVDFNNNWWYDVGLGQNLARDLVNVSVFFEEYRALVPGLPNAREVLAAVTVRGAAGWRMQISAAMGLSDGAPDHGFTLGASRRF